MSNEINNKPEEMASFFNVRAITYEDHMKETVENFDRYYLSVSNPIEETDEPIEILDLGCGTGLEIEGILEKAPNAIITCIDMAEGMLELLREKYKKNSKQIKIIVGSYMDLPLEFCKYDYVVSVMTMHHWKYEEKLGMYQKIYNALKEGGKYIEGDYYVTPEDEREFLKVYEEEMKTHNLNNNSFYHIDIPFAVNTQKKLYTTVGFRNVKNAWEIDEQMIFTMDK